MKCDSCSNLTLLSKDGWYLKCGGSSSLTLLSKDGWYLKCDSSSNLTLLSKDGWYFKRGGSSSLTLLSKDGWYFKRGGSSSTEELGPRLKQHFESSSLDNSKFMLWNPRLESMPNLSNACWVESQPHPHPRFSHRRLLIC